VAGPLERALGFLARSIFWLGLVYSSMPFDSGPAPAITPVSAIAPAAALGAMGACAEGLTEGGDAAIEKLRLAAEIASFSARTSELARPPPMKPHSADTLSPKDKTPRLRP
jgi:hypothetical protein